MDLDTNIPGTEPEVEVAQPVEASESEVIDEFLSIEGAESEPIQEVLSSDEVQEAVESILAPDHWADADKEIFNTADPTIQQWLLDRHKSMEGDYTRKAQQVAEERRQYERDLDFVGRVRQQIAPIAQLYASRGIDEAGTIGILSGWFQQLSNPQTRDAAFRQLGEQLGVQLNQAQVEDEYVDPSVQQLRQELNQFRAQTQQQTLAQQQYLQQQQAAHQQQAMANAKQMIDEFRSQKDEYGNLKYPLYEKVQEVMGKYMNADQDLSMEKAYGLAVQRMGLTHPVNAAQKARQAKRAASGVRSNSGVANSEELSQRDLIAHIVNSQM
jgi:hypothetical protein